MLHWATYLILERNRSLFKRNQGIVCDLESKGMTGKILKQKTTEKWQKRVLKTRQKSGTPGLRHPHASHDDEGPTAPQISYLAPYRGHWAMLSVTPYPTIYLTYLKETHFIKLAV